MNNNTNYSVVRRRSHIIQLLDGEGRVDVKDLSGMFAVSSVSIRKDLAYLEKHNLLIRTRGGAIKQQKMAMELELSERAKENVEQKRRIGAAAANLIDDGDSIILDSGTTTIEIAKRIKNLKNLTVITDALNIAIELAGSKDINLIMPGGMLHEKSFTLLGPMTEKNLRDFNCDKYFLGAYAVDTSMGIYTPSISEASVNNVMGEIAKEIILVVDSTKFGKKSLCLIMPISKICRVITDDNISEKDKQNLTNRNIEVIVV